MKSALLVLAACAGPDASPPATPVHAPAQAAQPPAPVPANAPEGWLKGSTHVHARPSGDSSEPIDNVLHWYEEHGYDFIALTDHNRVTDVDGTTAGTVAVHRQGLIVLAGVELTENPDGCQPQGDVSRRCRIHVNAIGVTARPAGKIEWADRKTRQRVDMYHAAFVEAQKLGARLIQINHPNYYWGMTPELLASIGPHAQLVEIANAQFAKWNAGDKDHPSVEAQWDAALDKGVKLWGVASDDAHDYEGGHGGPGSPLTRGKYPPGGGWIMVKARRDPQAILDAIAAGHFYASSGVTLTRAEVEGEELVVEVAPEGAHQYAIELVENGRLVESVRGPSARRILPQTGYVRAVVTSDDGKKAWVQPHTR